MNRLMPEEEARIRIEANSMIYRGDHDAAFEYKADILKLLAELDAVRADLARERGLREAFQISDIQREQHVKGGLWLAFTKGMVGNG